MSAEFDKLKYAIKQQLKKDNPNMADDQLDQQSFAIATSQFKKQDKKTSESINDKFDEDGRYIVSENTKFYIEAGITSIEE